MVLAEGDAYAFKYRDESWSGRSRDGMLCVHLPVQAFELKSCDRDSPNYMTLRFGLASMSWPMVNCGVYCLWQRMSY